MEVVLQQRTAILKLKDGCVIILACGHEYGAQPVSPGTIDELATILSRHIGKQQRCYKCERESEAQEHEALHTS